MPERDRYRSDPTQPADKRRPRYLQVLITLFIFPLIVMARWLFKGASKKAIFLGTFAVTLIGWSWSMMLSANQWWIFPKKWLIGIWLLPNLPLEEMLFYPIVTLFMIGTYNLLSLRWPAKLNNPWLYRLYLYLGTLVFLILGLIYREEKPYYIYSQLIVFNLLAIVSCEVIWKLINPKPFILIIGSLFVVGLVWDYFAFKYDWWIYNPLMGPKFLNIPIEDVNFYLYATPAGISLYLLALKHVTVYSNLP